ncbi:MAG: N-6 DNA methylase [Hyphomicrobium sp.]|nr:N-6 DNA methylase [Hyphomicrobium sp.]
MRAPLEALIKGLAELCGQPANAITAVGETTLAHLATRPDYSVTRRNELIGFIEVKAPGKGADPRQFTDEHDKKQWGKLKTLPNLIYTDGNSFSLWQDGERQGGVVQLEGDVMTSGKSLSAPPALQALFESFFAWQPIAPRTAKQLAETSARYCRLLREEVKEELGRNNPGLTTLAQEWRNLLFPQADADQFADGYAQAVTFGLLVARVRDVDLSKGLDTAANELRKSSTLIGTALRLLVDDPNVKKALATSLDTLRRVLNEVHWQTVTKGNPEAWLYFYEDFLEVYDNTLRKRTGSYYTPPEVVEAMVRLTDEALRDPALFDRREGLAASSVTICDPAVGTGTFLLGVLKRISETIAADQGEGAVPGAIAAALDRIIGFELQFGPFAVAQLRIIAEMQALIGETACVGTPRLYVTDTLGDPYAAETQFSPMVAAIGESRKEANKIKRETPITVVIGNPPYKDKAGDRGGWIENGGDANKKLAAPMDSWMPPAQWDAGVYARHLKNLYIYFWRWATLKVFGSGWYAATGQKDEDRSGIICFISVAGFLNGPGFQKMRKDLRRDCAAIWVIDCSPEGHQPEVNTRIFQGVQQPVCIVLAARSPGKDRETPARLKYMALPEGHREQVKFPALKRLSLGAPEWRDGPGGWREPFLPEQEGAWASFPGLDNLFVYNGSGVMAGRTWIIAPEKASLQERWAALIAEKDLKKKEILFHPHLRGGEPGDKHVHKAVAKALSGHPANLCSVAQETAAVTTPVRYAFRTLDRQWIIPDARVINQSNPTLWEANSNQQAFLTAPEDRTPSDGPALSICGLIPDVHHYHGRGGRVYPLWRNAEATVSNIKPALVAHLAAAYGHAVSPEDVMAYLAAVMAHPAFTARFQEDLVRPGLRVPITASADLFARAVNLGRELIWLHTYGERFADPKAGRPSGAPRMAKDGPTIPKAGAIPSDPDNFPDEMTYDAAARRLFVGKGYVDNVTLRMFDYDVSGMNVLKQWFSYRKKDRSRPIIGDRRPPSPLSDIQPDHWLAEYTSDLIDLLHVLGRLIAPEPQQAMLLEEILAAPLIDLATLTQAGALEAPPAA